MFQMVKTSLTIHTTISIQYRHLTDTENAVARQERIQKEMEINFWVLEIRKKEKMAYWSRLTGSDSPPSVQANRWWTGMSVEVGFMLSHGSSHGYQAPLVFVITDDWLIRPIYDSANIFSVSVTVFSSYFYLFQSVICVYIMFLGHTL